MKKFLAGGVVPDGPPSARNMFEQFEQDRALRILNLLKDREGKRMQTVRAKFNVGFVEDQSKDNDPRFLVRMYPVYSDDPNSENKVFTDATPGGELSLLITKPETAAFFVVGQEYYLDISKA